MEALALSDLEGPLLALEGTLPYQVDLNVEGFLTADPSSELSFTMETSNSPTLLGLLDELLPLEVESFVADAEIGGTLSSPQGAFDLSLRTEARGGRAWSPTGIFGSQRID